MNDFRWAGVGILAMLGVTAQAATAPVPPIPVFEYEYLTLYSSRYPDSTGELTDGVDVTIAWGNGQNITFDDVAPLVGWQNTSPRILFTFERPYTFSGLTIFAADSDGAAGVGLPSKVKIEAGEPTWTYDFINPPGSGSTVGQAFSFEATTDSVLLTLEPGMQWTMLSEVSFYGAEAVPEPATIGLLGLGLAVVGGYLCKRRRG